MYCEVNNEKLKKILQWIVRYNTFWINKIGALEQHLPKEKEIEK
jgi:hypothetical protein